MILSYLASVKVQRWKNNNIVVVSIFDLSIHIHPYIVKFLGSFLELLSQYEIDSQASQLDK